MHKKKYNGWEQYVEDNEKKTMCSNTLNNMYNAVNNIAYNS